LRRVVVRKYQPDQYGNPAKPGPIFLDTPKPGSLRQPGGSNRPGRTRRESPRQGAGLPWPCELSRLTDVQKATIRARMVAGDKKIKIAGDMKISRESIYKLLKV
jgi:hypothetical protein